MTTTPNEVSPLGPVTAHGALREIRDLADLPLIWNPDCNSVLLRRPGGTVLTDEQLDALERCWRYGLRIEVSGDQDGLQTLLEATDGMPGGAEFAATLFSYTRVFCDLTGASAAGMRLAMLDDRMCPRFHSDRVLVRMLLTLRGTTTEIATDSGLGQRLTAYNSNPENDPKQAPAPQQVMRPEVGDLLLLRGGLWEETEVGPAVHRSPAASRSKRRLMCTWDPIA